MFRNFKMMDSKIKHENKKTIVMVINTTIATPSKVSVASSPTVGGCVTPTAIDDQCYVALAQHQESPTLDS